MHIANEYILKNVRALHLLVLAIIALSACADDFTDYDNRNNKMVVSGAIEVGEFAKLSLTMSMDVHQKIDSSQYLNIVNTLADVKISNGEREEYMVLRRNDNRFPFHYYESRTIKGEAGKTYSLEIRFQGDTIRAQTTIPLEKPDITDVWSQKTNNDTMRSIHFRHCSNNQELQYFRNFYKTTTDYDFVAATSASFSTQQFVNNCNTIALYQKKMTAFLYSHPDSFRVGDTLELKISAMSQSAFEFWIVHEQEILNAGNPFLSTARNLPTNVQGGLGVWCGYNSHKQKIVVE